MASLIGALAKRDLTAQYRDSAFGILWACLKPTLFMLVFSVLKGALQVQEDTAPFPLFSFTGIVLWLLFVSILQGATPSITRNAGIIRKMPTPRLVYPLSGLSISLAEFLFALVPLGFLLLYFEHPLNWYALWLFPIAIITALSAFAIALPLATFSVFRNDLLMALPYVLQAGLFLSPILYSLDDAPPEYRNLLALNPMAGPLEGLRAALLYGRAPDWALFGPSAFLIFIVLPMSAWLYSRASKYFADFF